MKKICFVCSANECRSPMAQKIFERMLKENNNKDIKVSSAGIGATEGTQMTLAAKRALKSTLNLNVGSHKSKQLKVVQPNVLYITMTKQHKNYLNKKNVFTFAELVGEENDIEEPYGQNQEVYNQTAHQIDFYSKKLYQKLKNIK